MAWDLVISWHPKHPGQVIVDYWSGPITSSIGKGGTNYAYIQDCPPDIQLLALKDTPGLIEKIPSPTREMKIVALKNDGSLLLHMSPEDQADEEFQLIAVQRNPLIWIENGNFSEAATRLAVSLCPYHILYMKNPSEELKALAVSKCPTVFTKAGPAERPAQLKQ